MNLLSGFVLYVLGAFALILSALLNIVPTNYLGGFVVAGFIGGLVFAWLNAWRQGERLVKTEISTASGQKATEPTKQIMSSYPCMKELVEGTKQGEVCIYSGGCERVTECVAATISSTA